MLFPDLFHPGRAKERKAGAFGMAKKGFHTQDDSWTSVTSMSTPPALSPLPPPSLELHQLRGQLWTKPTTPSLLPQQEKVLCSQALPRPGTELATALSTAVKAAECRKQPNRNYRTKPLRKPSWRASWCAHTCDFNPLRPPSRVTQRALLLQYSELFMESCCLWASHDHTDSSRPMSQTTASGAEGRRGLGWSSRLLKRRQRGVSFAKSLEVAIWKMTISSSAGGELNGKS
jgi:hypothetical protein